MTGFGLAHVKQQGYCTDFETGVSFKPLDEEFNIYYSAYHTRWYYKYLPNLYLLKLRSRAFLVWKNALLENAKVKL